jgi:hypothetical protein
MHLESMPLAPALRSKKPLQRFFLAAVVVGFFGWDSLHAALYGFHASITRRSFSLSCSSIGS